MLPDRDDAPSITGHDIHFLRRLERVNLSESDLALRLYRDRSLVRAILADGAAAREVFRKPGDQPRVAIAIGSGESPPHVVVNHEGIFITCLGGGMAVDRAPVVPWERVRIHLHRADTEAKELARAGGILKATDGGYQLMHRLFHGGLRLSREEFEQIAAIEPTLFRRLPELAMEVFVDIMEAGPPVARVRHFTPADVKLLRAYWNHYCALGHLFVAWACGGRARFELWIGAAPKTEPFSVLFLPMIQLGFGPVALRALFVIARAGKVALPPLKRALAESNDFSSWYAAVLGLAAIGVRHQKLRAEVLNCFTNARLPIPRELASLVDEFSDSLLKLIENAFQDEGADLRRLIGRPHVHKLLARLDPDNRLALRATHSDDPEYDPRYDPLVVPLLCATPLEVRINENLMEFLCAALSVAAAEPEDLYLPAQQAELLGAPFSQDLAFNLAQPWRPGMPVVREEKKVGRNDPCRCGSGKKWKRCCGA